MATKAMSEMTDAELLERRDGYQAEADRLVARHVMHFWLTQILANQYDAELTRRTEGK